MIKVFCPYCEVNLCNGLDKREGDEVARCEACGEITCNLCIEQHYIENHEFPWKFGYMNEAGEFIPNL